MLLAATALAPAAWAQQQQQQQQPRQGGSIRVKATDLFDLAAQAETAGNTADAEAIYRALSHDPDVEIRSEARFRLGMMLSRLKRDRDAAIEFRAILDEKPDAGRVRLELARILTELGDDAAARRELRQAQAGGLPPQVAQVVDQFAQALRSRKPWGASVEFALVPDSNINRATDAETLDTIIAPLELSRDAREQSGLGARAAGQVYARIPIATDLSLLPRLSGQGEFYRKGEFDDVSVSALIGLEWSPGRDRIRPSVGGTFRWYGGALYAGTATASLDWQHPLGRKAQLTTTLTVADTDYRQNDLQDGLLLNGSVAYERAFSARSGGSITLTATRQTARDPGYANAAGGMSLLYWREMGRTTAYANAGVRRLVADQRLFLFPERRSDWNLTLGAGATFRALQWKGFAPLIRFEYERNSSTVGLYDYRRTAATFGITRAF